MLRYHPYPRVGLSQRELLTASHYECPFSAIVNLYFQHIIEENDPLLVSHAIFGIQCYF